MSQILLPGRSRLQPVNPRGINPRYANKLMTVWVPSVGPKGLGGAVNDLTISSHVSTVAGINGKEWRFTGTDYNTGITAGAGNAWFILLGSAANNTTGANMELLGTTGDGLRVTSGQQVLLRVASTTHISGALISAGQSIFAGFNNMAYTLSQRNRGSASNTWQTSSTNYGAVTPSVLMNAKNLSIAMLVRFKYMPSRSFVEALHRNPWMLFERPSRPLFFAISATAVSADLGDSYAIQESIASDLSDANMIRAAVTADMADSAYIRALVASDLADSYAIRAAVAAELADNYAVLSSVAASLADAYAINASVNADLGDSYLLRASVAQDLADGYTLRASIASDLADSYDIINAGAVVSDLADAYLIRAATTSDMTDSAVIRAAVLTEIEDAYSIRAAVMGDMVDGYTIINAVSADLIDVHAIRAAVAADLLDAYSVFSGSGTGATVEEIVAAILAAAQTNPIHANIQKINDVEVVGAGVPGDEWGAP